MSNVDLFHQIEKLLQKKANAAHIEDLKKYYIPEMQYHNQSPYFCLASSLQNGTSSGMDKTIKFNGVNRKKICEVLHNCDYQSVLDNYKDEKELYKAFTKSIPDKGDDSRKERAQKGNKSEEEKNKILNRKTQWEKYALGLYEGAKFLKEDEEKKILNDLLSYNNAESIDKRYIKNYIERIQIKGLGIALCCDWLKECGCVWLVKPDVHIRLVYKAIKEKETGTSLSKIDDYEVIAYYFNWVKELRACGEDITAYQLDKMIWLICTGDFYLDKDVSIGRDTILEKIHNAR